MGRSAPVFGYDETAFFPNLKMKLEKNSGIALEVGDGTGFVPGPVDAAEATILPW